MRCPECGQKECCGASLSVERDRYREALGRVATNEEDDDISYSDLAEIAREALRGEEE